MALDTFRALHYSVQQPFSSYKTTLGTKTLYSIENPLMPCWIETDDHHTNTTQGSFTSVFKIFSVYSHQPTWVTCFGRILLCPDPTCQYIYRNKFT